MDFKEVLPSLLLGILLTFVLNWIYFFDWTNLIGKLVKVFAPQKEIKEIEKNLQLRESETYRVHIKKWKKKFLLSPLLFALVFLLTAVIFDNLLVSYFSSLITVGIVVYGFLVNKEMKEKKKIIDLIHKEKQ